MWTALVFAVFSLSSVVQCADDPFHGTPLPQTLVFDLDHTTWKAYLDVDFPKAHGVDIPKKGEKTKFTPDGAGKLKDDHGKVWEYSADIVSIATDAKKANIKLAVASRAPEGEQLYTDFLKAIKAPACSGGSLYGCFDVVIIKPGDKKDSLENIAKKTGAKTENMILFDDEPRNKDAAKELHVYFKQIGDGGEYNPLLVSSKDVEEGIKEWRKQSGGGAKKSGRKERKKARKAKKEANRDHNKGH